MTIVPARASIRTECVGRTRTPPVARSGGSVVAHDREVVPRHAQLGPAQREHLGDDAELEQAEAVADEGGDEAIGGSGSAAGGHGRILTQLVIPATRRRRCVAGTLTRMVRPPLPRRPVRPPRRPSPPPIAPRPSRRSPRLRPACAWPWPDSATASSTRRIARAAGPSVRSCTTSFDSHVNAYLRTKFALSDDGTDHQAVSRGGLGRDGRQPHRAGDAVVDAARRAPRAVADRPAARSRRRSGRARSSIPSAGR